MKLRIAVKVLFNHERGRVYRKSTLFRAQGRIEKAHRRSLATRFFNQLRELLGVEGRAKLMAQDDPAGAFQMLMETDQSKWKGTDRIPEHSWVMNVLKLWAGEHVGNRADE